MKSYNKSKKKFDKTQRKKHRREKAKRFENRKRYKKMATIARKVFKNASVIVKKAFERMVKQLKGMELSDAIKNRPKEISVPLGPMEYSTFTIKLDEVEENNKIYCCIPKRHGKKKILKEIEKYNRLRGDK